MLCAGCKAAMQRLRKNCDALTKLSITSIMGSLLAKGVITYDEKRLIETKPLESDRVTCLLDDVLYRSLLMGVMDKYITFVKVLEQKGEEEYDMVMEKLATNLGMLHYRWKMSNFVKPIALLNRPYTSESIYSVLLQYRDFARKFAAKFFCTFSGKISVLQQSLISYLITSHYFPYHKSRFYDISSCIA